MLLRGLTLFCAVLVLPSCAAARAPGVLPIYIEENHAGSFRGFTRMAELDEAHTLVLLDGHSDASAVDHSDEVREGIRRVRNKEQREERITQWRRDGRIQAYSWIEALMPRPVEHVLWIAGTKLTPAEKRKLQAEAEDAIDGRVEIEARQAGEFSHRWNAMDIEDFLKAPLDQSPILATIDLDFFTEMAPEEARRQFLLVWEKLLAAPDLRGVTIAISRPWLKDDAEGFRLLLMALNEVRLVRGAEVMFEPFAPGGRDNSLKAAELATKGLTPPTVDIAAAPPELRRFLAIHAGKYRVTFEEERWNQLLDQWRQEDGPKIATPLTLEGILRVSASSLPDLRLTGNGAGKVRWWALLPASDCYNLLPQMQVAKGFTKDAIPWVRERRVLMAEAEDSALAAETWKNYLDRGWGRLRIEAEVETDEGWKLTPPTEVRAVAESGFHAGLSEQFGMPYVFGIGFVGQDGVDGPDSGWGNDCANFLIYAWRRTGRAMGWGNPAQLRARLRTLAEGVKVNERRPIPNGEIERGLVIDFGNHVAAVWKDLEPFGILDAGDEVVHHLGGLPEKTTMAKLCEIRPPFSIRALPLEESVRIVLGGDVVLQGVDERDVRRFPEGDVVVANLEGIPSNQPVSGKRYNFAFSPDRLEWLAKTGLDAVSMANNHAGDAGVEAIPQAVKLLQSREISVFGAGQNRNAAVKPWITEVKGVRLAFFGACAFAIDSAGSASPGIATLPAHQAEISQEIARAKSEGCVVIVLIHWGREYTQNLDESQVTWGRWLADRGADAVVGAHPHVVQSLEFWRGRPMAFSLGNAVYPAFLKGADGTGWLTLVISASGKVTGASLVQD